MDAINPGSYFRLIGERVLMTCFAFVRGHKKQNIVSTTSEMIMFQYSVQMFCLLFNQNPNILFSYYL